jgi:hypothetical protein
MSADEPRRSPPIFRGKARFLLLAVCLGLALGCDEETTTACPDGQCGGHGAGGNQSTMCNPGDAVFCRCPTAEAGTKVCNADGMGFGPCRISPTVPCP